MVLSKGYTKAYGFRGDGLKTYTTEKEGFFVYDLNQALIEKDDTRIQFWYTAFQATNAPTFDSNYWNGFTLKTFPNYQLQIAFGITYNAYIRIYDGTSWGAWHIINE